MKVVQISTLDNRGGAALVSWNLMNELVNRGIDCRQLVKKKFSDSKNVTEIRLNYLQNKLSEILSNDIDFGVKNRILSNNYVKDADIVHLHNVHGPFLNIRTIKEISRNKRTVWTLHDMWAVTGHCAHSLDCDKYQTGCGGCPYLDTPPKINIDTSSYMWSAKKTIYSESKLNIVTPSFWLQKKFEKSILCNASTTVIHNGINTDIFKQIDKRRMKEKLGIPQDKKVICTVSNGGTGNFWKGGVYAQQVIDYFNKDYYFLIIGGQRRKQSGNVYETGYLSNPSDLNEFYNASDIYLFTSIAENFPLVILEAMAAGLPIISFDIGGVSEAVEHTTNGYLAKEKNVNDLIKGITNFGKMPSTALREIGNKNNYKVNNKFTIKKMTDKYMKLYNEIL